MKTPIESAKIKVTDCLLRNDFHNREIWAATGTLSKGQVRRIRNGLCPGGKTCQCAESGLKTRGPQVVHVEIEELGDGRVTLTAVERRN